MRVVGPLLAVKGDVTEELEVNLTASAGASRSSSTALVLQAGMSSFVDGAGLVLRVSYLKSNTPAGNKVDGNCACIRPGPADDQEDHFDASPCRRQSERQQLSEVPHFRRQCKSKVTLTANLSRDHTQQSFSIIIS